MKCLAFVCLLACTLISTPLSSQVYNHSLAAGFNTFGYELKPLGNGRWLAVGKGKEIPGCRLNTVDSVIAVVFNENGEITQKQILQLPQSGTYGIRAATGTADGGYAIAITQDACDVVADIGTMQVFGQDGQLRWSKSSAGSPWTVPDRLLSTPDGHILAVYSKKFIKYELQTGAVLFEAALQIDPSPHVTIRDLVYYPGTEDLVGVGYPNFQYWQKTGLPDAPVYQLSGVSIQPYTSVSRLAAGAAGQYFTLDGNSGKVFEFTVPDLTYTEILDLPFKIYDIAATSQGLILCSQMDGMPQLLTSEFSGQITDTILVSDQWQIAYRIALQDSVLALLGYSGSGPAVSDQPWYPYNSTQLWLQTRPLPPLDQFEILPDAALTAMSQDAPLEVLSVNNGWYVFKGGQFKVQVQNTGSQTLQSVDVQIGFEWINNYYRPVERRHFSGLSLAPGESTWLDFGDFKIVQQSTAPTQFCFWTARPNEKPDADHSNDDYCHAVLVAVQEPSASQLRISPNPSAEGFWVNAPNENTTCNLFDSTGRLIQTSKIPTGQDRYFVPTANLPNGMYIFQLGKFIEKIIVQHE
jgi:hypothetical protein